MPESGLWSQRPWIKTAIPTAVSQGRATMPRRTTDTGSYHRTCISEAHEIMEIKITSNTEKLHQEKYTTGHTSERFPDTINSHTCPGFPPRLSFLQWDHESQGWPNRDSGPHVQMPKTSERACEWCARSVGWGTAGQAAEPVADSENPREKWVWPNCLLVVTDSVHGKWNLGRSFKAEPWI